MCRTDDYAGQRLAAAAIIAKVLNMYEKRKKESQRATGALFFRSHLGASRSVSGLAHPQIQRLGMNN